MAGQVRRYFGASLVDIPFMWERLGEGCLDIFTFHAQSLIIMKAQNLDLIPAINRIVIGDVGSGKTLVAFISAITFLNGLERGEVVMLAPTEVLAYQHYLKLLELKAEEKNLISWLDCIFLSGKGNYINGEKLPPAKFKVKFDELSNQPNPRIFWVGTHAVLFNEMITPDLVMVDEQHRFGVRQREKLSKQQVELSPHFISFTATPIPRTLALTVYDTLQPIFLETLQSRKPIQTSITTFDKLETEVIAMIKSQLVTNKKVYVICTAVEQAEDVEDKKSLWSVTKTTKLMQKYFGDQLMSVHGKMNDKKDILSEFKSSETKNILVATTVVEVGVDVGEATLVVILNAERFGLSALHQIRGRVGRNNYENNYCMLVTYKEFSFGKRLRFLCQHNDGFVLAQKDLELRGSGDAIGSSQSGFGSDIDQLIGLNPDLYTQIKNVVKSLDFDDLSTLPRLEKYLAVEKSKVWEE
jgi:ATP-dependent DNA helicase RecG